MIRARAPLRIDLAGGWTDVPAYASKHGGAVVNVAITLYAHALVTLGGKGIRLRALDMGTAVNAQRLDDLREDGELGLVKAITRTLAPEGPLEIMTRCDAPPGSGLGGSGALGVALVAALDIARDARRMPAEVAGAAFTIETGEAGIEGGCQDQYAAALGGIQFLSYGARQVTSTRLSVSAASAAELEQSLVLCYSGATRFSGATHRRVWSAFERGDAGVRAALDGLKSCAQSMRQALERGRIAQVGDILSENWRLQRELVDGMRTPAMAELERVAESAGAGGAKACGAGAGGCIVFLARPGQEFELAEKLEAAGGTVLRFAFDSAGVTAWKTQER